MLLSAGRRADRPTRNAPPAMASAKVADVTAERDTRVQRLVVDTNALIKRVRLDEIAQQLYTVPSVLVRPRSLVAVDT